MKPMNWIANCCVCGEAQTFEEPTPPEKLCLCPVCFEKVQEEGRRQGMEITTREKAPEENH